MPLNLIVIVGFHPFLMLTNRFSVILGGLFIYYVISEAVILFSDRQLQAIFHGIQQSKTAYSIIHTIKRSRTKNYLLPIRHVVFGSWKFGIVRIYSFTLWEASRLADQ